MPNPSLEFPFAIYRCTASTDNEGDLANQESIGMEIGLPDTALLGIVSYSWDIPARRTDVPAPQNQATAVPDTGLQPPTLTIGVKFNEQFQDRYEIGILTLWALQDKTVRTNYPNGRFGIRNNKKPWMNFQPTAQAGWKIVDVNVDDVLEWGGMVDAVITLHFGGQTSLLATAIQALLTEIHE